MLKPDCPNYGYTLDQLDEIFPEDEELRAFNQWMYGQTRMLCTGELYDHELGVYVKSECYPGHGPVTYWWDVERYLGGLPIID